MIKTKAKHRQAIIHWKLDQGLSSQNGKEASHSLKINVSTNLLGKLVLFDII